jgi:hypothetical protein
MIKVFHLLSKKKKKRSFGVMERFDYNGGHAEVYICQKPSICT